MPLKISGESEKDTLKKTGRNIITDELKLAIEEQIIFVFEKRIEPLIEKQLNTIIQNQFKSSIDKPLKKLNDRLDEIERGLIPSASHLFGYDDSDITNHGEIDYLSRDKYRTSLNETPPRIQELYKELRKKTNGVTADELAKEMKKPRNQISEDLNVLYLLRYANKNKKGKKVYYIAINV